MKTYVNVPCPKCGANLDVPVQVASLVVQEGRALIAFHHQDIPHECKK